MERHKQMSAMSAKQRDRFEQRGVKYPTSTFLPPEGKKPAPRQMDTGPDQHTVNHVIDRDGSSCVVCGKGIDTTAGRGVFWSIHHRLRRGQGVDNRTSNLILVCGGSASSGCHGNIHGGPNAARRAGWLIRRTDMPHQKRMAHASYGYVLLDNEGGLVPVDAPEVGHG